MDQATQLLAAGTYLQHKSVQYERICRADEAKDVSSYFHGRSQQEEHVVRWVFASIANEPKELGRRRACKHTNGYDPQNSTRSVAVDVNGSVRQRAQSVHERERHLAQVADAFVCRMRPSYARFSIGRVGIARVSRKIVHRHCEWLS